MRPCISLLSTFLPQEMHHVYRQVSNLSSYSSIVIARKRKNPKSFPFANTQIITKGKMRILNRLKAKIFQLPVVGLCSSEISNINMICEQHDYPLVHVYQGDFALRCLSFIENYPSSVLVSFHGADLARKYSVATYSALWQSCCIILCRSLSMREALISLGCPPPKIMLNYTGVPMPKDIKNPATFSFSSGKIKNLKILQVCRFLEKKGLETTIHAFSKLLQVGFNGSLDLVGDGPIKQSLMKLVSDLGISDKVNFRGFLTGKDLMDCFMNADIFSHPSCITADGDREGIPNSLLEAMSYGLPVVATYHSGIPEVIKNRENGLLIDSHDIDSLTSSFIEIITNPHLSIKMAQKARETINSRFSISACVTELEKAYDLASELKSER
jgi:colanic acid/amylovoran biosynthesis glycosyltransferase